MENMNHRGPQINLETDCTAAMFYLFLLLASRCFLGSHLLSFPMDRHGISLSSWYYGRFVCLFSNSYCRMIYNNLKLMMAKSAAISKGASGERQYLKVFLVLS